MVQSIGRARISASGSALSQFNTVCTCPADDDAQAVLLNQIGDPFVIRRCQRVLHRFGNQSLPLVPHAGAAVQAGHRFGRHAARQPLPQHLGKQMMVAIPLALIVQRHDKQVGALQLIQDELAVANGRRTKDKRG